MKNAEPKHPFRRRRILVVEDTVDIAESLVMILEQQGHEVQWASNGPTALRIVEQSPPDVVLLDIGLPAMNGYEVARRLREMPGGEDITIIALSGYGQEKDIQHGKRVGFDLFLVKPCDVDRIEEAVVSTVHTRGGAPDAEGVGQ